MNRKVYAFLSLLIILSFIGYIIYDTATSHPDAGSAEESLRETDPPDQWTIFRELLIPDGPLLSVAVSENGDIYLGGESYLSSYNQHLSDLWHLKMPAKITAVTVKGDTIYAATQETIFLVSTQGIIISEWGPYEINSIITSISAGNEYIVFADAGTKRVFVLGKSGEVVSMMGQSEHKFIIPSPYFDVALSGEDIYVANTGRRRIEKWSTDGMLLGHFGEAGTAPGAFCGCCNPAHFAVMPMGFITAEKGINRLKILGAEGDFIEFVSSRNEFIASIPLDIASIDGKTIYAVNPADSKLYVFKRKNPPIPLKGG
jgi:hypothetical protein